MTPDDLTLSAIDSQAHLTVSHEIVDAVAFAVRSGHCDRTARRFVTALVMSDTLRSSIRWPEVLSVVAAMVRAENPHSPGCSPLKHRH